MKIHTCIKFVNLFLGELGWSLVLFSIPLYLHDPVELILIYLKILKQNKLDFVMKSHFLIKQSYL